MKWSVGVTEYWSIGIRAHHSATPVLQHSSHYEVIGRNEGYESFSAAC